MKTTTTRRFTRNYDPAPKNKSGIDCFYQSLIGWGVIVTVANGELVITAPNDNVSPALRQAVERRKDKLIKHIEGLPK